MYKDIDGYIGKIYNDIRGDGIWKGLFQGGILGMAMLLCYPRFRRQGHLIPMYMIGYGAIRFVVEGLRTDSLYIIPGLRVSRLLSLILVACGCVLAIIMHHKAPTKKTAP